MTETTQSDSQAWPSRHLSQAISEGDGISVIPVLTSAAADVIEAVEQGGAAGIVVRSLSVASEVRERTDLPILLRGCAPSAESLGRARAAGADAVTLVFQDTADPVELLPSLYETASDLGLDCPLDVRDEDELDDALERIDPEILVLSERDREKGERDLDRTLALLADVPAGKLVISEGRAGTRAQVLELERAGVDALIIDAQVDARALGGLVAELVGGELTNGQG